MAIRKPLVSAVYLVIGTNVQLMTLAFLIINIRNLTTLALKPWFLPLVSISIALAVLARVVVITYITLLEGRAIKDPVKVVLTFLVLLMMSTPASWGLARTYATQKFINDTFAVNTGEAIYIPPTTTEPRAPETTEPPLDNGVPDIAPEPEPEPQIPLDDPIYTILLLGGDGGPGRWSDRTDSMVLVTVNLESGDISLISVPRNLSRLEMVPGSPLESIYMRGFDEIAAHLFTRVANSGQLVAAYSPDPNFPLPPPHAASRAVAETLGYNLNIQIDDYLFVDMLGFSELVDTLGGVYLELDREYRIPPNVADPSRPVPARIGPGPIQMDGPLALSYSRTRYQDSDYARMGRQRQVLQAMAEQTSPVEGIMKLPAIIDALRGTIATSIDLETLAEIAPLIRELNVVTSVQLSPPLVDPGRPNYEEIRQIVSNNLLRTIFGPLDE